MQTVRKNIYMYANRQGQLKVAFEKFSTVWCRLRWNVRFGILISINVQLPMRTCVYLNVDLVRFISLRSRFCRFIVYISTTRLDPCLIYYELKCEQCEFKLKLKLQKLSHTFHSVIVYVIGAQHTE